VKHKINTRVTLKLTVRFHRNSTFFYPFIFPYTIRKTCTKADFNLLGQNKKAKAITSTLVQTNSTLILIFLIFSSFNFLYQGEGIKYQLSISLLCMEF